MKSAELAHFERLLLDERRGMVRDLERIRASAVQSALENRSAGVEPTDSVGDDRNDDAIAAREVEALKELDEALRILYEAPEEYGVCVACGRPIALSRLEIVPATRYCQDDAKRQQNPRRRPRSDADRQLVATAGDWVESSPALHESPGF